MKKYSTLISIAAITAMLLAPVQAATFDDVKTPSWYSEAVDYVVTEGYMTGVGNGKFDPGGTVTRAQVVQILYAKEGKPAVQNKKTFSDVPEGKWYAQAVYWSSGNGIVAGYPDNTFQPDRAVTREQLVAILYQYAKYKGSDVTVKTANPMKKYPDAASVSNYAKEPISWALEKGLISGTEKGIEPKGTATRAQIAVIIKAYCEGAETEGDTGPEVEPVEPDQKEEDKPDEKQPDEKESGEETPPEPSGSIDWELPEDDG